MILKINIGQNHPRCQVQRILSLLVPSCGRKETLGGKFPFRNFRLVRTKGERNLGCQGNQCISFQPLTSVFSSSSFPSKSLFFFKTFLSHTHTQSPPLYPQTPAFLMPPSVCLISVFIQEKRREAEELGS